MRGHGINPDWNEGSIACLRSMWTDGLKCADIARRMGRTRNSIIGKVHRLDLPQRPSPIREAGSGARPGQHAVRRASRAGTTTLPQLPRWCTQCFRPLTTEQTRFCSVDCYRLAVVPRRPKPTVPRAPKPEPRTIPLGHVSECCFALNGGRPWKFCCEPTEPGKPYCAGHWRATHVKQRTVDPEGIAA